ncbi:MAG: FAD-dependent oxidoreductase, partial [Betaproteobacteria bacterium]|nr:FAD-dependent oxidoreductase [Betaproteobacteria bacterium]
VVSGAAQWVEQGRRAIADAVVTQWHRHFGHQPPVDVAAIRIEQRATFSCTPAMLRPDGAPLPGISVAGDYIAGRYPATLEGAVRSGLAAVATL